MAKKEIYNPEPAENAGAENETVVKAKKVRKPFLFLGITIPVLVIVVLSFLQISISSAQIDHSASSYSAEAAKVSKATDLADKSSKNVYQQQVTAQWGTNDLLQVIADQNAGMESITKNVAVTQNALLWGMFAVIALLGTLIVAVLTVGRELLKIKSSTQE